MRPRPDDGDDVEPPTKYRCVEATSTSASSSVSMDCTNVKSRRRRTKAEVAAAPIRRYRSVREKLEIVNYAKQHRLRRAATKYHVPSPKNIGEWEEREEGLKKLAHMNGGHRQTLHAGKPSQYHETEGTLRRWLLHRRKRQILVTKKMMIKKAKEVSATLRALMANQLEDLCPKGEFLPPGE